MMLQSWRFKTACAARHAGMLLLLCQPLLLRAQSAIPFKHENSTAGGDFSRIGLALILCLAVLAAVLYLLRRYLPGVIKPVSGCKRVQVLETQRLGPRSQVYVVAFGGRQYLIGQSEHGLVRLASAPLAEVTDVEPPDAQT